MHICCIFRGFSLTDGQEIIVSDHLLRCLLSTNVKIIAPPHDELPKVESKCDRKKYLGSC